jgi:quercetin dioxygenase-like cupin family protein
MTIPAPCTTFSQLAIGALALGICVSTLEASPPADLPSGTIQFPAGAGTWNAAAASLPPGTQIMVLEGDPSKEGLFTIRLKMPAGASLAPHWHPRDERVTVMSGEVLVGFGDHVDKDAMARFTTGGFYVNPANSHHYVQAAAESVLQLTGIGPWEVHFLEAPKPRR